MDPFLLTLAIGGLVGGWSILNKRNQAPPAGTAETGGETQQDTLSQILSGDIGSAVIGEVASVIEDPNRLGIILWGVDKEKAREEAAAARASISAQITAGVSDRLLVDNMMEHPLYRPPVSVDLRTFSNTPGHFQQLTVDVFNSLNGSSLRMTQVELSAVTARYNVVHDLFKQSTEGRVAISRALQAAREAEAVKQSQIDALQEQAHTATTVNALVNIKQQLINLGTTLNPTDDARLQDMVRFNYFRFRF